MKISDRVLGGMVITTAAVLLVAAVHGPFYPKGQQPSSSQRAYADERCGNCGGRLGVLGRIGSTPGQNRCYDCIKLEADQIEQIKRAEFLMQNRYR